MASSDITKTSMWKRISGEYIPDLEETLLRDISRTDTNDLKFYVGADSQISNGRTRYTVVLVVRKANKGAQGYYSSTATELHCSRNQRLFQETYMAVELAIRINPLLEQIGFKIDEVHSDLSPHPKNLSNQVVQTCLGYIQGFGFKGKIKPESWASYCVADLKTK